MAATSSSKKMSVVMKAVLLLMATAGESSRASATDNLLVIHYQPGGKKDQWCYCIPNGSTCVLIFSSYCCRGFCVPMGPTRGICGTRPPWTSDGYGQL
jgi:hypothetical protein